MTILIKSAYNLESYSNFWWKHLSNAKPFRGYSKKKVLNGFSEKKVSKLLEKQFKTVQILIWTFDGVANWIFPGKRPSYKLKCQIKLFHELLPGNLVFFHFYYIGTKEIQYMDHIIEFSMKNYIIEWNCTSGVQFLTKSVRKQAVWKSCCSRSREIFPYSIC